MSHVCYTNGVVAQLEALIAECQPDRIFVLCDDTTQRLCLPAISSVAFPYTLITIPSTDAAKTLDTLASVWAALQKGGATRHSLLLNLGGGMVTDLGGFAAATFKRGLRFINVPTTLLGMVDAAVGGKTGINFGGLKNEVGCFRDAEAVVIDTQFLRTLDAENLRSGYAEMLKHSLLSSEEMWRDHLLFPLAEPCFATLQNLVQQSIEVKQRIVEQDPHEQGIRKALNLGHTVGHAIESLYLENHAAEGKDEALLHGYAVAWGLVAELYIAAVQAGFPTTQLHQTAQFVFAHYGRPAIGCKDYDHLYALMRHDKKNCGDHILFTLISRIGEVQINQEVEQSLVNEAIDFLRDA